MRFTFEYIQFWLSFITDLDLKGNVAFSSAIYYIRKLGMWSILTIGSLYLSSFWSVIIKSWNSSIVSLYSILFI